jgi:CubicO group peptidase (beta-lactamase class C family)
MLSLCISRFVLTAALAACVGSLTLDAQSPQPAPCGAPEYRQFDFWIGDWVVTRPDGKPAGTNRIERIAGDCGLQETWTAATGGGTGHSLNGYSPQDGRWHQVWIGSGGLLMHLTGGLRDGRMVLEGETVTRDKARMRQRITWTAQPDGRVRQLWEQSKDDGQTWSVAFDGMYSKRKPE